MPVALAVSPGATAEVVAAYATLESATLGGCRDVDDGTDIEELSAYALAERVLGEVVSAELRQVLELEVARRLEMASCRLGDVLRFAEADLDGAVTIALRRPELGHEARANLDGGRASQAALPIEELDGAQFASEKSFNCHGATA